MQQQQQSTESEILACVHQFPIRDTFVLVGSCHLSLICTELQTLWGTHPMIVLRFGGC